MYVFSLLKFCSGSNINKTSDKNKQEKTNTVKVPVLENHKKETKAGILFDGFIWPHLKFSCDQSTLIRFFLFFFIFKLYSQFVNQEFTHTLHNSGSLLFCVIHIWPCATFFSTFLLVKTNYRDFILARIRK